MRNEQFYPRRVNRHIEKLKKIGTVSVIHSWLILGIKVKFVWNIISNNMDAHFFNQLYWDWGRVCWKLKQTCTLKSTNYFSLLYCIWSWYQSYFGFLHVTAISNHPSTQHIRFWKNCLFKKLRTEDSYNDTKIVSFWTENLEQNYMRFARLVEGDLMNSGSSFSWNGDVSRSPSC